MVQWSTVGLFQYADLLKKLKNECIKLMDDAAYKTVVAKLELVTADLCEYFPVLKQAVGTLTISISLHGITDCSLLALGIGIASKGQRG